MALTFDPQTGFSADDVSDVRAAEVKDLALSQKDAQSPDGSSVTPRTLTGDIQLTMEDGETYGIDI